jgi:hypothetical protein
MLLLLLLARWALEPRVRRAGGGRQVRLPLRPARPTAAAWAAAGEAGAWLQPSLVVAALRFSRPWQGRCQCQRQLDHARACSVRATPMVIPSAVGYSR